MSVECSNVVWSRNFNGSSRKMVAVKLADHADDEGRGIWPSVEKVAAKCDLSCRTVQRVLSDFVKEGILKVVSEGGNGPRDTRRYDFDMAVVRALPLAVAPPDSRPVKGENKGDTVSPLADGKGDIDDAKGDTDDKKGCHGVTQTIIEPPIEPSLERARARDDGDGAENGKAGDRTFKRAFAQWPTFVSDSEPAARKAWAGLATEERLQAVERQADYIASVKATGRAKFCAYAVYLAEKRWEKLAARPAATVRSSAPAYGPAWSALRMERLLAGPVSLGPPEITRESRQSTYEGMARMRGEEWARDFYRKQGHDFAVDGTMLFPADFDERQMRAHRAKNGYPDVNTMHAAAEAGEGITGTEAERGAGLAGLMEFVVAAAPLFEDWRRWHEDRGWPFPPIGRMRGLYFPAGGPDRLYEFERAIRTHEHAA